MDKADPVALTPANANPWYVLMTLFGEQTGSYINEVLHDRNRAAWNAWSCQAMSEAERATAAKSSDVTVAELAAWPEMQAEVGRLHEAEMLRRNDETFVYPGLPDVAKEVHLVGVEFGHHLVMSRAVFGSDASFDTATFSRSAIFMATTFSGAAFSRATFSGVVSFDSATVRGEAWFGFATFSGYTTFSSATFSEDAWFHSAKFSADVWFHSATFSGRAKFGSATFGGDAQFDSATFIGRVGFPSAIFDGPVWFLSAKFSGNVWFGSATFSGFAHFTKATFGIVGQNHAADFSDSHFQKPTSFRDAIFLSRYPDFSGTVLHDKTAFTADDAHWPKTTDDLVQAKASCAVIRHTLGKQGLPEAEHFFYRREMAYGKEIGGFWERLPFRLYDWLSGYGYSIERPVRGMLWLWLLPSFAFFMRKVTGVPLADVATLFSSLGLSFANMFSFLGLQRTFFEAELQGMGGAFQALAGFQTVMGFVLLFFVGLGLRTRFRLK